MSATTVIKAAIGGVATIVLLSIGACSMETVDTGKRGVTIQFGEPTGTLDEGLHFVNPFTTSVKQLSVRQIKWTSETSVYTEDVQPANVKYTVTYSLSPDKVLETYQNVGEGWAEAQIPQVTLQAIKDVFGDSEAVADAIQKRGEVQSKIRAKLMADLRKKGIILHGFELEDIRFSQEFEEANEQKQVAVEKANAAKNRTVQIEEEAKQRVITAQAEADAMRIRAEALARNPALTEYEAVKKWNGVLPNIMLGDSTPMININQ
jgi:regulator of protease activity HflC (stomatin/prohibitin superfamily)